MWRSAVFTCLVVLAAAAAAAPAPGAAATAAGLRAGEQGRVAAVVDGDTVVLEDGLVVRLVGIQAPKLPLGRPGLRPWPLAAEARAALAALCLGQPVTLSYGGRTRDRYDRALAHLHLEDGIWVQGRLLLDGWVWVYSFSDNRALVADMLVLEGQARGARRGIWGLDWYRIRDVQEVRRDVGSFQLVEGDVRALAVVRGRLYLNFGDDWRSDFTISVAPRDLRGFAAAGLATGELARRRLRVRGWVKRFNGPMIEVTHPEQLELLGRLPAK